MTRVIINSIVLIAELQLLEFVIAYHRLTKGAWRKNYLGVHNMVFMAALFMILLPSAINIVVRYIIQDIPAPPSTFPLWFDIVRLVIYLLLPLVILWRRFILQIVQKEEKE